MNESLVNILRQMVKDNYRTENLRNEGTEEFKKDILQRIGQVNSDIEGFNDASKQRDLSVKFHWGHDHDFGNFSVSGSMGERHINIIAKFIADYGLPLDLSGKRVLDIGVWTGGTCLLLASMGAEVVGCEEVRKYADTVNYLAHAFGISSLKCVRTSLFDLNEQNAFDYVIFSGVIYHVTDPILSLRILFNALKDGGEIFVETYGVEVKGDNVPPLCRVEGPSIIGSGSEKELNRSGWNYYIPNDKALQIWLNTVGFQDISISSLDDTSRLYGKGVRYQHQDFLRAGLSRPDIR